MTLIDYFYQGGPVMYFILLASIIGLTVFIERLIYLGNVKNNGKIIMGQIREKLKLFKFDEALAVCDNYPGPASNILKAGLETPKKSRDEIEEAMEAAAVHEMPGLKRFLPVLATVASVSTLLGLLGTVFGMMNSSAVLSSQGLANPSRLIAGISQALITTAYGLIVAIPAVAGYNYIAAKIDSILSDIEIWTKEFVKLVKKEPDKPKW